MKIKPFLFAAIVCGTACLSAEEPKNLLGNPSFTEKRDDGTPAVWNSGVRGGAQGKSKADFSLSPSGQDDRSAGRIAVAEQPRTGAMAEFSQCVPLKSGATCYVAVYMKILKPGAWANACVEILGEGRKYLNPGVGYPLKAAEKEPAAEYVLMNAPSKSRRNINSRTCRSGFRTSVTVKSCSTTPYSSNFPKNEMSGGNVAAETLNPGGSARQNVEEIWITPNREYRETSWNNI